MKKTLKIFSVLSFLFLGFSILFYGVLIKRAAPEIIEKRIFQDIEQTLEGVLSYDQSRVTYFPFLKVVYQGVRFESADGKLRLKADEMELRLKAWKILIGRSEPSRFSVKGAQVHLASPASQWLRELNVSNVAFLVKFKKGGALKIAKFEGDLAGVTRAFAGQIRLDGGSLSNGNWKESALQGEIALTGVNEAMIKAVLKDLPAFQMKNGLLNSRFNLQKEKGSDAVSLEGSLEAKDFSYAVLRDEHEIVSPSIPLAVRFQAGWNPLTEELVLKRTSMALPSGRLDAGGRMFLGTGEIQDMRFTFFDILLEDIPRYLVMLKDQIPYNTGFSGTGSADATLGGRWDHLSIHANVDLTASVLTYGRYFVKPKDTPLTVNLDFLVKKGNLLQGDFSLRSQGAVVKGTIADMELSTGESQVNVITNKFQLEPWNSMIVPLQNFEMAGIIKILANFKGNLFDWPQAQKVLNVTLEHGSITGQETQPLKEVELIADFGQMSMDIKKLSFELAGSRIDSQVLVYDLFKSPNAEGRIRSEYLEPLTFLRHVQELTAPWAGSDAELFWNRTKNLVGRFFPDGKHVSDFETEFSSKAGNWEIKKMNFNAYGGKTQLTVRRDAEATPPLCQGSLDLQEWRLGEIATQDDFKGMSEGNLFLNLNFSSPDPLDTESFLGEGSLLITGGTINSFDLMNTIAKISEFNFLANENTTGTHFDDFKMDFHLEKDKLLSDRLVLASREWNVEAAGEVLLNGFYNFRLGVFLSEEHTQNLLQSLGQQTTRPGRFGPIPMIFSGRLENPELQPDPDLLPDLLSDLRQGKTQKSLRTFLPEETLFRREGVGS